MRTLKYPTNKAGTPKDYSLHVKQERSKRIITSKRDSKVISLSQLWLLGREKKITFEDWNHTDNLA